MRGNLIPRVILDHWFRCGRKRPYPTEVIASLFTSNAAAATGVDLGLHAYVCPVAAEQDAPEHWHLGHPRNGRNGAARVRQQAISVWNDAVDRVPRKPHAGGERV